MNPERMRHMSAEPDKDRKAPEVGEDERSASAFPAERDSGIQKKSGDFQSEIGAAIEESMDKTVRGGEALDPAQFETGKKKVDLEEMRRRAEASVELNRQEKIAQAKADLASITDADVDRAFDAMTGTTADAATLEANEDLRLETARAERSAKMKRENAADIARQEAEAAKRGPGTMETRAAIDAALATHKESMADKVDIDALMAESAPAKGKETGAHVDPEGAKKRLVAAEARLQELNGPGGVDALEKSLKELYKYDPEDTVQRSGFMGRLKAGLKSAFNPGFRAMKKSYDLRLKERNDLQEQILVDREIVADPEGFAKRSKDKASLARRARPSSSGMGGPMNISRKGP